MDNVKELTSPWDIMDTTKNRLKWITMITQAYNTQGTWWRWWWWQLALDYNQEFIDSNWSEESRLRNHTHTVNGSVDWGCRIHWLYFCRGVRLPQWVSWIWHKTIWWWDSSNAGTLRNADYPFIAITLWSTLAWSGSTEPYLSVK